MTKNNKTAMSVEFAYNERIRTTTTRPTLQSRRIRHLFTNYFVSVLFMPGLRHGEPPPCISPSTDTHIQTHILFLSLIYIVLFLYILLSFVNYIIYM